MILNEDIITQVISEMIESGEMTLGWNNNIKKFTLEFFKNQNILIDDIYGTLLYKEDNGVMMSKSFIIPVERVKLFLRDKNITNLLDNTD